MEQKTEQVLKKCKREELGEIIIYCRKRMEEIAKKEYSKKEKERVNELKSLPLGTEVICIHWQLNGAKGKITQHRRKYVVLEFDNEIVIGNKKHKSLMVTYKYIDKITEKSIDDAKLQKMNYALNKTLNNLLG